MNRSVITFVSGEQAYLASVPLQQSRLPGRRVRLRQNALTPPVLNTLFILPQLCEGDDIVNLSIMYHSPLWHVCSPRLRPGVHSVGSLGGRGVRSYQITHHPPASHKRYLISGMGPIERRTVIDSLFV